MQSQRRLNAIFLNGMAGRFPENPLSYSNPDCKVRLELARPVNAYLAGGSGSETTIDFSRQVFRHVKIHPVMLDGVQEVSMQLKWREHALPAFFMSTYKKLVPWITH